MVLLLTTFHIVYVLVFMKIMLCDIGLRIKLMAAIWGYLEVCPVSLSFSVKTSKVHCINDFSFLDIFKIPEWLVFT